jgi:hypothetical protein
MKKILCRTVFAAALLSGVVGCSDTKPLHGNYRLERWEDNKTFYLQGPAGSHVDGHGGGLVGGMVLRLAWNDKLIGVERFSTFRGDPDGWMIIDIESGKISGPISTADFEAIRIKYRLQVKEAGQAWNEL